MKAVGDKIVLKKLEDTNQMRMYGNIHIPAKSDANAKMTKGEIISIGPQAQNRCLEVGDIVLYDTMSVFDNTKETVITNIENIILKIIEE